MLQLDGPLLTLYERQKSTSVKERGMASGMEYKECRPLLLNSDDPLSTYHPDQRKISLESAKVADPPGRHFLYNKCHPQLLGMILERTTGVSVAEYLQTKLWDSLGMEFDGSWNTDSETSDFEKMETGVNARAIDFAKFGAPFLNEGNGKGIQDISQAWMAESTGPNSPPDYEAYYSELLALVPGRGYHPYVWWGMACDQAAYDFAAEGDKGQYIYVSPQKELVIVRNGINLGIPWEQWLELLYEFASRF